MPLPIRKHLDEAIELREQTSLAFAAQAECAIEGECRKKLERSNRQHRYFNGVLREIRRIQDEANLPSTTPICCDTGSSARPSVSEEQSPNRYTYLEVFEPTAWTNSAPKDISRDSEGSRIVIDKLDEELSRMMCFLLDLKEIRAKLREYAQQLALDELDIETFSVLLNTACFYMRATTQALPSDFCSVLSLLGLVDERNLSKKHSDALPALLPGSGWELLCI